MDERRKFRRTPAKEKALLQSKEHHSKQESQVIDVSSGGMRILSDTPLKAGTMLSGQFKIMPTLGNFYIAAEVMWVKPKIGEVDKPLYEIGVKFNKVSTIPV